MVGSEKSVKPEMTPLPARRVFPNRVMTVPL